MISYTKIKRSNDQMIKYVIKANLGHFSGHFSWSDDQIEDISFPKLPLDIAWQNTC